VTGAPHSLQNLEFNGSCVPHDPHGSPVAVSAPWPSSTPISFHCWSAMSVISLSHAHVVCPRRSERGTRPQWRGGRSLSI